MIVDEMKASTPIENTTPDWNDLHLQMSLFIDNLAFLCRAGFRTEEYEYTVILMNEYIKSARKMIDEFPDKVKKGGP